MAPLSTIRQLLLVRASDVTSGALLRRARQEAGLTQREVAIRAGVQRSVVSAYESGSRQLALATLATLSSLVEACGVSLEAAAAIMKHLQRGPPSDGPVFDAVRLRLIEIGEAVKDVHAELLSQQPSIPWRQVPAMRDQLAHHYFDTSHSIVAHTVGRELVKLLAATRSLLAALDARG